MKVCCVVATVYQLINALNILCNDEEYSGATVDLFIKKDDFKNGHFYCERLKKIGIFHEVNEYNACFRSGTILAYRLKQIMEYYAPGKTIENKIDGNYHFAAEEYDVVLSANYDVFTKLVLTACRKAAVYAYEDGTLNYSGFYDFSYNITPFGKKVMTVLGLRNKMYPERIYLNTPQNFVKTWDTEVKKIPSLSIAAADKSSVINKVFVADTELFKENCIVLFPPLMGDGANKITAKIANSIQMQFVCRYHPRMDREIVFSGIEDRADAQWELLCARDITDDHVLIGPCSTAQISPKWLFDKEPYLIFTQAIYGSVFPQTFLDNYNFIMEKTQKMYRNPDKIFVVSSIEEMNAALDRIEKEKVADRG